MTGVQRMHQHVDHHYSDESHNGQDVSLCYYAREVISIKNNNCHSTNDI